MTKPLVVMVFQWCFRISLLGTKVRLALQFADLNWCFAAEGAKSKNAPTVSRGGVVGAVLLYRGPNSGGTLRRRVAVSKAPAIVNSNGSSKGSARNSMPTGSAEAIGGRS